MVCRWEDSAVTFPKTSAWASMAGFLGLVVLAAPSPGAAQTEAFIERQLKPRPAAEAAASMQTTNPKNRTEGLAAYDRALVFLQQGALAEASADFRNAEKKDDNNPEFVFAAAYGYLKVHKPDEALKRYEKFYKKDPRNLRALAGMGTSYDERQNFREAVRTWQRYTKSDIAPADRPAAEALLAAARASFIKYYEIAENPAGGADNLLTPAQELEMGMAAGQQIADAGLPALTDRTVVQYVEQLSQTLVSHSKNFPTNYRLSVLDTADVNAFTVPGFIFVNRGLLAAVDSEAELAGVVAHEIAHSVAHHFAKKRTKEYQDQKQLEQLKQSNSRLSQFFAKLLESGNPAGQLSFSREAEYQADRLAVHICYDSGIDPLGFASFFQKLESLDPSSRKSWDLMQRTHPFSIDRLNTIREYAALLPAQAAAPRPPAFAAMKKRLAALPPPPDVTGQLVSALDPPASGQPRPNAPAPRNPPAPPSAPPAPAPEAAPAGSKMATRTFSMNGVPFAGELPADWTVRKTEAGTSIFEGPREQESYQVSIEIGLEPKANLSIDDVAGWLMKALSGRDQARIDPIAKQTADDGTPVRIVKAAYSLRASSGQVVGMRHLGVVLDYPGYYVIWSYYTPEPIHEKYSSVFTMMLERFHHTGGDR